MYTIDRQHPSIKDLVILIEKFGLRFDAFYEEMNKVMVTDIKELYSNGTTFMVGSVDELENKIQEICYKFNGPHCKQQLNNFHSHKKLLHTK